MSSATRRIETVRGPRELGSEGLIDAHGHVWNSPPPGGPADAPRLDREDAIADELAAFAAAGGTAVVDCQPPGAGRDARRLVWLADATGVAIIAATGFHLRRYYPDGESVWTQDAEAARARFLGELTEGMVEDGKRLPARAGVVKVAHPGRMEPGTERLLAAAAAAAAQAGVLLVVHTERGAGVEALAEFLVGTELSSHDVMLCHIDKRPDLGLHRQLAGAGFLLSTTPSCARSTRPRPTPGRWSRRCSGTGTKAPWPAGSTSPTPRCGASAAIRPGWPGCAPS